MQLLLILLVIGIGWILISEIITPHRDNNYPGTRYREPKD